MSTIATALIQAKMTYDEARAQKQEGKYVKQVHEANARMAEMNAEDATYRGEQKATEVKKQTKKLIGAQRAAMAAQGLDLEEDDALAIQQESAEMGAVDAQEIKNNAWREAWGYRVQAANYYSLGRFAEITARQRARKTILTGGLSILNTFASSSGGSSGYSSKSSSGSASGSGGAGAGSGGGGGK